MRLALIAPTCLLDDYGSQSEQVHLALAHEVLAQPKYADWFLKQAQRGDEVILDNGTFEHGKPLPMDKILLAAQRIHATTVVAPDFPKEDCRKTVHAFDKFRNKLPEPYKLFVCPQSEVGDYEGWFETFCLLSQSERVSHIGISILACPNAFQRLTGTEDIEVNRLVATNYVRARGWTKPTEVKVHYLGLGHRVEFIQYYHMADSLDTASPIRHGLVPRRYVNGILPGGKTPGHLEFGKMYTPNEQMQHIIQCNIRDIKAYARLSEDLV